jgi:hypothetical protein
MTDDELAKLEAGPAMDDLIVQHVFGKNPLADARIGVDPKNPTRPQWHWGYPVGHDFAPAFSTDMNAAMQVFEKMNAVRIDRDSDVSWLAGDGEDGPWFALEFTWFSVDRQRHWQAGLRKSYDYEGDSWGVSAMADTAPLAICRAALRVALTLSAAKPKCRDCGTTEGVTLDADPYSAEINDDDTPVWLCGDCRHERAMDI